MLSNIERTFVSILAERPRVWHEIEDHPWTWDYLAEDMDFVWRLLVKQGAVRRSLFSRKWSLTRRGWKLRRAWT